MSNLNLKIKEHQQLLPFKAVIFDCDGVLINSEKIGQQIELKALERLGIILSNEEYNKRFVGLTTATVFHTLSKEYDIKINENIIHEVEQLTLEALEKNVDSIQDIHKVLEGIPLQKAVASNSHYHRLIKILDLKGISNYFGTHIYSADMVAHPKPAPDLYLFVAKKLGLSPEECLVIEDSCIGIQAAHQAGMTVYGFMGTQESQSLGQERLFEAGAEVVFNEMNQLSELLQLEIVHH